MINLRPVTLEDAKLLFDWHNNSETRQQSGVTEEVSWENHVSWMIKSLAMAKRKLYVAEHNGRPIGIIRSDITDDDRVKLSWTIAPLERRKGFGKAMVIQFVKQLHPKQKLLAIIRKGNIPSEKIAQALGLHQVGLEPGEKRLEEHSLMIWR